MEVFFSPIHPACIKLAGFILLKLFISPGRTGGLFFAEETMRAVSLNRETAFLFSKQLYKMLSSIKNVSSQDTQAFKSMLIFAC